MYEAIDGFPLVSTIADRFVLAVPGVLIYLRERGSLHF